MNRTELQRHAERGWYGETTENQPTDCNGAQVLCDLPSEGNLYAVLRTPTSPQF
jgi:predicted cupin superfamily sugar epimerase